MPINPEICQTSGEKGKRQMIQKEVSSVSAPSDIILPATVNAPGHFQLMIGRQLNMVPIPNALHDLLPISCVAPSRTFSHKSASWQGLVERDHEKGCNLCRNRGIASSLTVDFEEDKTNVTPLKNAKKGKMLVLDKLIELRTKYFALDEGALHWTYNTRVWRRASRRCIYRGCDSAGHLSIKQWSIWSGEI